MSDDQLHKLEKSVEHSKAAEKPLKDGAINSSDDNKHHERMQKVDALRSFKLTAENPNTGVKQQSFTIDMGNGTEIKDSRVLRVDQHVNSTPDTAHLHERKEDLNRPVQEIVLANMTSPVVIAGPPLDVLLGPTRLDDGRIADRGDVIAWNPDGPREQLSERKAPSKNSAGEFERIKDAAGELKIPVGDPDFGYPDSVNGKAYSKRVNHYVKWIETYDGKEVGWEHMSRQDKINFANSMRHAIGIAYLIYKGLDPDLAVKLALGHEAGDTSVDSQQDRRNNVWAAHLADQFACSGKNWNQLVAYIIRAAQHTCHSGFLDQYHKSEK